MVDQLTQVCKSLITDSKSHLYPLVVRILPLVTHYLRERKALSLLLITLLLGEKLLASCLWDIHAALFLTLE